MANLVQFKKIENQKEFFLTFQGLCKIAEQAFNKFDEEFKDKNLDISKTIPISKNLSYLMSITFVIMGMRGDYGNFSYIILKGVPFFVEIEGIKYDHEYLYKMNDYFASRFNQSLDILKNVNPEAYSSYKTVWGNF